MLQHELCMDYTHTVCLFLLRILLLPRHDCLLMDCFTLFIASMCVMQLMDKKAVEIPSGEKASNCPSMKITNASDTGAAN